MATRKYYTLVTWEGDIWAIQFGDYDRTVVQREREDSYHEYPKKHTRIVCSGAKQVDIVAAVAALPKL